MAATLRSTSFVALIALGVPFAAGCGVEHLTPLGEWEYRWDVSGTQGSTQEGEWLPLETLEAPRFQALNPPNHDDHQLLWLRARLPRFATADPVLYIGAIRHAGEVYLGADPVYRYRQVGQLHAGRFRGHRWHMVTLPAEAAGQRVRFRVYSERPESIGLARVGVGSREGCIRTMVRDGVHFVVLGILFLLIGAFAFISFALRRHAHVYFAFGLISVATGLMTLLDNRIAQLFVEHSTASYTLYCAAPFVAAIGSCLLYACVFPQRTHLAVQRLWVPLVVVMVVRVFFVVTEWLPAATDYVAEIVAAVMIAITMLVLVLSALCRGLSGDREARLFAGGFAFFGLLLLYEIGDVDGLLSMPADIYPWGMLLFVLVVGFILERRYQAYSVELERNNRRLEEYSQTLEQKVTARTRDLDSKNQQLEALNEDLECLVSSRTRQLVEQEKTAVIGRMMQGVAHNLRTPLSVIKSANQLLERKIERVLADDSASALANKARLLLEGSNKDSVLVDKAQRQIVGIVDNLMQKSRRDHGVETASVDINELMNHEMEFFHGNPQFKHDVEKQLEFDAMLPALELIPSHLTQVIENLVSNALDAMWGRPTQTLVLRTRQDATHVYIEVQDNGVGISAEDRARIFDPFYSTKPTTEEATEGVPTGTGLGLPVCLDLLRSLGGELRVESVETEGSTFTVVLPKEPVSSGEVTRKG
ncbi:MAG: sensor histidine kinase [Deltaproteobacteria bacterium]|nr:sensor histidine kinase [Deltaproteobacteria bacterium]